MFSKTTIAILGGLASACSAHMLMATPVPYGKSTLDNSPLAVDGSDYPCKQRSGVYDAEGANTAMTLGSSQPLSFIGSATHGGGSCQVSISYDENPTANSTFKVIHSIEGGCPIKNVAGNTGDDASAVDPDVYNFTIPTTLPTGNATLAWTWFNKIGDQNMYMNCAPVTLTSASTKRNELEGRDTTAYDALPDMFLADVGAIGNDCQTTETNDLAFPNPGDSLEQDGLATATPQLPSGCSGSSSPTSAAGSGSAASAAPAPTSAPSSAAAQSSNVAVSGGVFATIPASGSAQASATSAPVTASSAVASSQTVPVAASSTSAAPASASTGTTGSGSSIAAGTACSTEGMWNCIGGTSFQQCASGVWSSVQQMASGTTCTAGQSTNFDIVASGKFRRSIRFSPQHFGRFLGRTA
jgi:hypothetical protein